MEARDSAWTKAHASHAHGDRIAARAASLALAEARSAAAVAFGARYGWRPSSAWFALRELVSRREAEGRDWRGPKWPALDHLTYFRLRGKPAAIVSQPYGWIGAGTLKASIEAFAREHGLKVEVVDHPGWWSPGKCLVIVWTRAP